MPAILNSVRAAKPLMAGRAHNAMLAGRLVWPLAKDTVTQVSIHAENGGDPPDTLPVNGTVKLSAKAVYADGHEGDLFTGEGVTFTSKTPDIATVTGNTVSWAHGGTALVTATIGGVTSPAIEIACEYAPESISVTPGEVQTRVGGTPATVRVSILPAEADQAFTATVKDTGIARILPALSITSTVTEGMAGTDVTLQATASDGKTDLTLTWESSNPELAAFTKTGAQPMHKILSLLKPGSVTITVKRDGYQPDAITFTIKEAKNA